ncbi:predicted protein [Postia placenta Mad-698-R]|nr:predicted protein [Postia placenta Mad-698-R]
MATFHIKLSRPPDGLTRKFVDAAPPSWAKLAARIESLYHIPLADIAVSYIDQDGDEVTLSSEEELQEYYKLLPPVSGEPTVIRFDVRDLAERNKPLPATPRSSGVSASAGAGAGYRGTFGQGIPMMYEVEDDWQRVAPGLGSVFLAGHETPDDSDGPHAFVELIESDVDGSRARDEDRQSAVSLADSELTASTPTPDKGKGKARSSRSSTESVVSAQGPEKHPVHVMEIDSDTSTPEGTVRTGKSTPVSRRDSTPRPVATGADAAPDPPLPDLDDDVPTTPTASLTNDVANLFGTLSTVFASHPELSEGVRNIVHNATSGTYWHAHRESVARAADEIRRSALAGSADARQIGTDARRAAEEAAGRRVAEAIANVVRVIGDVTGGAAGATGPDTSTPRSRRGSGHPRGSHPHDFGRHGHHHHHHHPSPPGEGWDDMLADLEPPEWMGSWGHGRAPGIMALDLIDSDVAMTDGEAPDSAQPVTSEEDRTPEKKKKAGDSPTANSPLQIISTDRGPFPQLEMFPVPVRRSHTMHGTGQRNPTAASASSPAADAITRRLGDMGFTADAYPSIPEQISTRVPRNAQLSREAEDTIVTDVLEHLLETSPAGPPQASGSGDVASSSNATGPSS